MDAFEEYLGVDRDPDLDANKEIFFVKIEK